jgi:hypothetical protein
MLVGMYSHQVSERRAADLCDVFHDVDSNRVDGLYGSVDMDLFFSAKRKKGGKTSTHHCV